MSSTTMMRPKDSIRCSRTGVGLHQTGGQPCRTGESAPEHAGLHGIQRQEGGAACIVIAQQGDGRFGGGFVLHHDVLQRRPEPSP